MSAAMHKIPAKIFPKISKSNKDKFFDDCDISDDVLSESSLYARRIRGGFLSTKTINSCMSGQRLDQPQAKLFSSQDPARFNEQRLSKAKKFKPSRFRNHNQDSISSDSDKESSQKCPSLKAEISGLLQKIIKLKEKETPLYARKKKSVPLYKMPHVESKDQDSFFVTMQDIQSPDEELKSFM
ncbi:unnamed protein product [Moneuplotes crassus]|uniref:Uncharacterized protein n=1 Tax=Euplotes crassus TaxID=5936 RepID=A0AAD2D9W0_EUPCR|nr:unnamed protein product [Moneuplotes crassus]